ncbi:MAG: hypothetical protein HY217_07425 [Candidatus Rokubacteria bacterium]|nr:hypothetical protein [Candidatus Rokubacteria bacterium]
MLALGPAAADNLSIGINIGSSPPPPPPVIVATPPRVVVVPSPPVYYTPGVDFNLFVYGGRYYNSFHNGTWFAAAGHSVPWVVIANDRVPKPVLAVPVMYYKVPPGQAKKMTPPGGPEGQGKEPKGKKWKDH